MVKYPEVKVDLSGVDGNAFSLLGVVARELKRAGLGDKVDEFRREAMAGDYDSLLQTILRWVDVTFSLDDEDEDY